MTLRRSSPDALTVSGQPAASSTTSEQVASKPRPLTADGGSAASAIAARTEATHAAQISDDDCSTTVPASCQTVIGCRAVASRVPISSNTPARALDVPTSTPMKACLMPIPLEIRSSLPARIAAVDEDNASCHQARRIGSEKQDDRGDLVDFSHPGHRRPADPGIIHMRAVFDEGIKRRGDVGWRPRIDADAAGSPFGGERFGEMVHRGLRGVVVALLLRLVDDEAGHRSYIHDCTRLGIQHVPAEGAAAPERAVEIDVDDVQPMLIG